MKRILVAMLFGLVAGAICATGGFLGGIMKFSAAALGWVLLNRAVMGIVIGVSGLKVHWAWNGIVMGMVVGSIFSYSLHIDTGMVMLPVINFFVNGIFGLMIEFFTSVVFKQRAHAPAQALAHAASA